MSFQVGDRVQVSKRIVDNRTGAVLASVGDRGIVRTISDKLTVKFQKDNISSIYVAADEIAKVQETILDQGYEDYCRAAPHTPGTECCKITMSCYRPIIENEEGAPLVGHWIDTGDYPVWRAEPGQPVQSHWTSRGEVYGIVHTPNG